MSERSDRNIESLLASNRAWAAAIVRDQPDFFSKLARQQNPRYFWIGCSDSRVPANQIAGLLPGEIFVHRNVANVVVHTDLNCLSALQFAVDVLGVRDVLVCGHYGCGGIRAALDNTRLGLTDNWLRHVQDVRDHHPDELTKLPDIDARAKRLAELNVIEQAVNVCRTTVVQEAWGRGQQLAVHGLIYGLTDGVLRSFGMQIEQASDVEAAYAAACRTVLSKD